MTERQIERILTESPEEMIARCHREAMAEVAERKGDRERNKKITERMRPYAEAGDSFSEFVGKTAAPVDREMRQLWDNLQSDIKKNGTKVEQAEAKHQEELEQAFERGFTTGTF